MLECARRHQNSTGCGANVSSQCLANEYFILVVFRCKDLLLQAITRQYPYYNRPAHTQEYYLHHVLMVLAYQPSFMPDVFHLVLVK